MTKLMKVCQMSNVKDSIINALKDDNYKLHSKI